MELASSPTNQLEAILTRPTIVSDLDGVVMFMTEAIVAMLNSHFGTDLVASDMTHYWVEDFLPDEQAAWLIEQFENPLLYENLAPDFTAIAALNAIHSAGFEVILTSDRPNSDDIVEATTNWIRKWRLEHDELILLGPGGKKKILSNYGPGDQAILFDDDAQKWTNIARPGVEVWSPARPWTPTNWQDYDNVFVFDSWDEVLSRLGLPTNVPIPNFSRGPNMPANKPRGGEGVEQHSH